MAHKRKGEMGTQFAALPWRGTPDGMQVLLLTSRGTGRWVIPKGWPIRGLSAAEVAAREAYEEAGLVGRVTRPRPIGVFHYAKALETRSMVCEVQVFLFEVERQLEMWPEIAERQTAWFAADAAAALVDENELAAIIRGLPETPQALQSMH